MKAKPLVIAKWLNADPDFQINLDDGKIKFIHFFQMHCMGCLQYGIPQTVHVYNKFQSQDFQVVCIHSVFENHKAMTEDALKDFISEKHLPLPVGIDKHNEGEWMPATMKAYNLQGTPSTVIIDGQGNLQLVHFGHFELELLEKFLKTI